MQDPDARPVYDLISALSAGRALPPQDIETPVVAELVGKGDTSDVNDVIKELRRATGANPEVQRLRKEYRDIAGVNPKNYLAYACLLYTSPSPRDKRQSRMPSSA